MRQKSIEDTLIVRKLNSLDSIDELTVLLHRAYKELADIGIDNMGATQDSEVTRRRAEKGECWVAELDGRLVGTITFLNTRQTGGCWWYDRPGFAKWYQFAVDPDFQRLGIGSALLKTVEDRARQSGATELAATTAVRAKDLLSMYAIKGFPVVGYIGCFSRSYARVVLSKSLQKDTRRSAFVEHARLKMMYYYSLFVYRLARKSNDEPRLWVCLLRRMKILSFLRKIRILRNIKDDSLN